MPEVVAVVKSPKEAYESMVDKGVELATKPLLKVFHQSVFAGCYIGFGGMLSMVVAGGLADAGKDNPAIPSFVFAALFPVNLLIILLSGGVLYTGTSATVVAAVYERKTHWINIPRTFAVAWIGNLLGALVFALLIEYCDMNEGLTAQLAIKVAEKKIKANFLQTIIKGVGCNWMVCMAVFLSSQAQDMAGKMVGIWFPISCFVAIGFEHIPANQYMVPLGMLAGAKVSVAEMFLKNFLPTTIGNTISGSLIVAGGYSYAFGRLGGASPCMPASRTQSEQFAAKADPEAGMDAREVKVEAVAAETYVGV
jgi:formate/nitrite transporter